eukprot:CAMPEP_0171491346 /NCGR_PEP_ID=MMETSP0958-20121227/3811_1 /TAXON_ID=87120 /ORGANISM="Aurantiochytrium limacinum, Strain ATCCMYA-1381" /LENGTH=325 /DNA_ID=CAMNT_0012024759 /DNA_START=58 /DNA_END=1035 /DNA_ORIENTATION=+
MDLATAGLAGAVVAACASGLTSDRRSIVACGIIASTAAYLFHASSARRSSPKPPQKSLTNSDNSDEEVSEEDFQAAAAFAGTLGGLSNESQLSLYAWFKQASVGDCDPNDKPSMLDFVRAAKWKAWNSVRGANPSQARKAYVEVVNNLAPGWRTPEGAADAAAKSAAAKSNSGGAADGGMAPRVSTFAMEEDKPEEDQTSAERLMALAGRGDLQELVKVLKAKPDLMDAATGEDGDTLLHMAADRGDRDMVDALVGLGAYVDAKDVDGYTPLVYALMNDNVDLACHLVRAYGADPDPKSEEDGESLVLSVSSKKIAALLHEASSK